MEVRGREWRPLTCLLEAARLLFAAAEKCRVKRLFLNALLLTASDIRCHGWRKIKSNGAEIGETGNLTEVCKTESSKENQLSEKGHTRPYVTMGRLPEPVLLKQQKGQVHLEIAAKARIDFPL